MPALEGLALRSLRGPAVRRLLALRERGPLSTGQVRLVAQCLAVSERTVWRWLAAAEKNPAAALEPGSRTRSTSRFTITPEVRQLLALWGVNVTAVHRELTARAQSDRDCAHATESGAPDSHVESPSAAGGRSAGVPSLTTLRRAIRRDLTAGERAGLAAGERAARKKDVFLARPARWRNACWEGDHVQAPVLVDVDGTACRPWITWFIDCATRAVMGVAVTPHTPSRDAVLAALRAAVLREDPYGPFGGLPEEVRIDRGKDFLAVTVTAALGALKATVDDLPAYTPHLKGTVESLNRSVERMHLVALPGYIRAPAPGKRPRKNPGHARLVDFATFTADLLAWVEWWNTEHRPAPLGGRTPLEVWQADPTPLDDISAAELWALTLEDDGRVRKLTTRGIRWRGRDYAAAWMTGQAGRKVRVRWMPHHDHAIEVYDPATGRHLGSAHLADAATGEQITAVRRARAVRARRLKADLEAAEKLRRPRYAAATNPSAPRRLGALTAAEADGELAAAEGADLSALALPDLIPPTPSPATWRTPSPPRASDRPSGTRTPRQTGRTAGEGRA